MASHTSTTMVDFHTQCRQRGCVFYPVDKRRGAASYSDIYRQAAPEVFKTPRVQGAWLQMRWVDE